MAIDHQGFGIFGGEDLEGGILFDRTGQVVKLAIYLGHDGGVGEARADGLGDIDGAGARGDRLYAAVRQGNLDVAHRGILSVAWRARGVRVRGGRKL